MAKKNILLELSGWIFAVKQLMYINYIFTNSTKQFIMAWQHISPAVIVKRFRSAAYRMK